MIRMKERTQFEKDQAARGRRTLGRYIMMECQNKYESGNVYDAIEVIVAYFGKTEDEALAILRKNRDGN